MTIAKRHRPTSAPAASAGPSAVAWITHQRALVARVGDEGQLATCHIERGGEPEISYVAIVARAIGDQERVEILGPRALRLALEREYVTIFQRPERLIDVDAPVRVEEAELVDRLYNIAPRPDAAIGRGG
jgi:hypothetical protein